MQAQGNAGPDIVARKNFGFRQKLFLALQLKICRLPSVLHQHQIRDAALCPDMAATPQTCCLSHPRLDVPCQGAA